jgi:hypothetical protein
MSCVLWSGQEESLAFYMFAGSTATTIRSIIFRPFKTSAEGGWLDGGLPKLCQGLRISLASRQPTALSQRHLRVFQNCRPPGSPPPSLPENAVTPIVFLAHPKTHETQVPCTRSASTASIILREVQLVSPLTLERRRDRPVWRLKRNLERKKQLFDISTA